jgi:hypothetical protein
MVYFPERQADGTWVARKLFTKRDPRTADFTIDGGEFDLSRDVTTFVNLNPLTQRQKVTIRAHARWAS